MAQTPWGEIPVHDAHVHFFSDPFYTALANQKKVGSAEDLAPLLSFEIPPADALSLADRWVAELDRNAIHRGLIASMHGDEQSVAEAVAAHPSRFCGYFMLDPTQPDALARVQAAAANPHLHCICLFPRCTHTP